MNIDEASEAIPPAFAEYLALLDEARQSGEPQVQGMRVRSIVGEQLAAIKLDSALRCHDPNVYLHRSGKPLGEAINEKPDDKQKQLFGTCDGGHCFV